MLVEEEEIVQDCATDATLSAGVCVRESEEMCLLLSSMSSFNRPHIVFQGTDQITRSGPNVISEKSAPPPSGSPVMRSSQSGAGMSNATSDPGSPELGEDKKDDLNGKNKKVLIIPVPLLILSADEYIFAFRFLTILGCLFVF